MSEDDKLQAKAQAAIKLSQDLPASTFVAVPDEDIVDLQVSGQFGRVLNRVLEYLYQSEPQEEVLESANAVKNNFEGMKQENVTLHQISLWAISNLLADFSVQSGIQNKTKVYDRDRIMTHIFGGVTSGDPLKPLTQEELDVRLKEQRDKIKTEIKDEIKQEALTEEEKRRDDRRDHRDAQRDEHTQKSGVSDDLLKERQNKAPKLEDDTDEDPNPVS